MNFLLRLAGDPEIGLGAYAQGVRVGPGVRMPRLPTLYRPERRWRLPEQADPLEYLEKHPDTDTTWRQNYASVAPLENKVLEVLHDQAKRGQVLVLSEGEARRRFPTLVVASLGAIREDKPDGEYIARVLFDGTHGLQVNKKTRIRDQERAPVAADLKSAMRAKAARGETTFAVTADISEAHRQVPIHPQHWRLLGCQSTSR